MMKKLMKLSVLAAVFAVAGVAIAGMQYRSYYSSIYGEGGSAGGGYLVAYENCYEYPDGMGGKFVDGYTYIQGYIAGNYVNEYENFYGLGSCPDNDNGNGNSQGRNYSISLNGLMVDATCTGQTTFKGSGTGQNKSPGQKPQNYTSHYAGSNTTYPGHYNNACVITGTDTSGNTETYGSYASADAYHGFQNSNTIY